MPVPISFSIPDDMRLIGFHESAKGWMAYVKKRSDNSGYLQGAVGLTPQEAIDTASKNVRDSILRAQDVEPELPRFQLGPLNLRLKGDQK